MEGPDSVDNENNQKTTQIVEKVKSTPKKGKNKKSKATKFVTSDNIFTSEEPENKSEQVESNNNNSPISSVISDDEIKGSKSATTINESWTVLWNIFYHDGPLYGLAEYQGKRVWYSVISQLDDKPRRFNLHFVHPDNLKRIDEEHERYRSEVGYHTEHVEGMFQPPRMDKNVISFKHIDYNPLVGEKIVEVDETTAKQYHPPTKINKKLNMVQ